MSPQNELETCLIKASKNQEQSYHFYEILLNSEIYFLPHIYQRPLSAQEQHVDTSVPKKISIIQVEIEGKAYTPFFSSLERIKTINSDEKAYYKLISVDFFRMIRNSKNPAPLILNPGSGYGKIFSIYEIETLANGNNPAASEKIRVSAGGKLLLGQPSNYPHKLVDVLKKNFKKNKNIKQAFLLHICNQSIDEKPHTLIVVDINHAFDYVVNTIGALINNIEIPDPPVDIAQFLNPQDPISKYCLTIKPFYKKKILGIF